MANEHDLARDISRAAQADTLLRSDLLTEAFDKLEADYIEAWRKTKALDTEPRERLWQALQIVGMVRSHLKAVVEGGKLAQAELDEIARLGDRKKILGII